MTKPLLHVLFNPSAAATLREALAKHNRHERAVCMFDDYSFGPIGTSDAVRVRWVEIELGYSGWDEVVASTGPFLEASCSRDVQPVAWISRRDSQTYAGFLWWLSQLGDAPCKVVDVTDLILDDQLTPTAPPSLAISPSLLGPDQMARLLGSEDYLRPARRAECMSRWRQLVADNAPLRILDQDGSLTSAPITYFDALLLSCATTAWRKMARIIGEALGSFVEHDVRQTSDLVLYARACALAESGALEWRGDVSTMHGCELRLPPPAPG